MPSIPVSMQAWSFSPTVSESPKIRISLAISMTSSDHPFAAATSRRSDSASSMVGATQTICNFVTTISDRSRPRRSQCCSRTSSFLGISEIGPVARLDSSAY